MNRKALLICYYFPPLGLGGVGRPLNLFKTLPKQGWDCDVLTVKPVAYRAYEPELLDGMDTHRIFRAGSRDPQRILYLLGWRKVTSRVISQTRAVSEKYFPDSKVGWVGPAFRLGRTLCDNRNYDCVISTSPPVSSHLVGLKMHAQFGIPWIADFRDFWTTYRLEDVFDNEHQVTRGKRLLEQIRRESSAVTVVNTSIAEYLGTGKVITNGYDSENAKLWRNPPGDDWFTLGLLGHIQDAFEVESLIGLLVALKSRGQKELNPLRILHVGETDPEWFRGLFRSSGLDLSINCLGQLPRRQTIETLSSAHAFYLALPEDMGGGVLPGRTFELLASGRPVIAHVQPESEVAALLERAGNAHCYTAGETAGAASFLGNLIDIFDQGNYKFNPLSEYARQYSSDAMAEKFAAVMDGLL